MAKKKQSAAQKAAPQAPAAQVAKKSYTGWIILGVVVAVIVILALWFFATYNGLVSSDENVNNKWSQVEASYQRRFDLIPNLQATVEGAANFEKSTYVAVTEARTKWLDAQSSGNLNDKVAAANEFDGALSKLLVSVEAYPDLKATANFQALQDELANTENKINVERSRYNDAVTDYNMRLRVFPSSMIAGMFGMQPRIYFKSAQGAQNAPSVTFSF